jgi:parallel beta-helix repeat protein
MLSSRSVGSLALLLALSVAAPAEPFDRFVNPFGTCPATIIAGTPSHDTIQAAVNAAGIGDLIGVCPGVYAETVDVAVDELTIRPTGASKAHVTAPDVAGGSSGFDVSAARVTIRDFEVSGFLGDRCGVRVTGPDVTVVGNEVHDNGTGICVVGATGALILNNVARDHQPVDGGSGVGIMVLGGQDTTVLANRLLNNGNAGIVDGSTERSVLQQNLAVGNMAAGIRTIESVNAQITRNTVRDSPRASGVAMAFTTGTVVDRNVLTNNFDGVSIVGASRDCTITLNRASDNRLIGFAIAAVSSCLIDGNRAIDNGERGIWVTSLGPGNTISRNYAIGSFTRDCLWDGSDAPLIVNNTCGTAEPAGVW